MVRMHEIDVAVLLAAEAQDVGVGETLVVFLGADVGAPGKLLDGRNLRLQIAEGRNDSVNLLLFGVGFEFEGNDVIELLGAGGFVRSKVGKCHGDEEGGEEEKCFHSLSD